MVFPEDQLEELKAMCTGLQRVEEGGLTYFRLPNLKLAAKCTPNVVDGLLCPMAREGYLSRMFYSQQIAGPALSNWKVYRILDQNWHAFSWQGVEATLRLAQMVAAHLAPLL